MGEEESTAREKEGLIDGGERRIRNCMSAVLSLITAWAGLSQTSCPQNPPCLRGQEDRDKEGSSPGNSRECAQTGQASWHPLVHACAKSDGTAIFPMTSQHSCRAFILNLIACLSLFYSTAPQTQCAAAQEWELEARRGIYLRQCCH